MGSEDFQSWASRQRQAIESALTCWLPLEAPAALGEAMSYAVLGGGKRLRGLLVLAAAAAVQGDDEAAMRAAGAIELIHAYSLVHDDLPSMDNDVMRRGKPTVHVRFGEAQALLAGDALQALAFELLTPLGGVVAPEIQARLCHVLARAAGAGGMAGGQAIDLASVGCMLDESQLRHMHRLKSGALLSAGVTMGAACGATELPVGTQKTLLAYGQAIGLAFQVVDDILDVTAGSEVLGKTAGKDAEASKPTYVSLLGLDGARQEANDLLVQAHRALDASGLERVDLLRALADAMVKRDY